MSGPNAAHAMPPERELPLSQELDAPPAPEPPMKRPGIKFDLGSIKAMLDEAYSALADANLANEQDNLASLAAEFLKISSIAIAACKRTTALHVAKRQSRSPTKDEGVAS